MKKIKEKIKSLSLKKWHITIILIGIIFISLGAFHTNVWFDESYSVALAKHSFSQIWTIGGNDVHPVLYYWGLHIIYLLVGSSILAYRLFAFIPIAAIIVLGYTHIRKDFGEKTGFIFSFLSAFLPVMSTYAIEIRMYSWAMLSVTILAIYAYRLHEQDSTKNWIIFGISSITSIYLHYYGLMAAGLINVALLIYLFIKNRKKGLVFIIVFGFIQLAVYLPWMMKLMGQMDHVSKGFWIGFSYPNSYMEIISSQLAGFIKTNHYKEWMIPTILSLALYVYMAYKTYKYIKEKQNLKPYLWAILIYLAVIISAIIITIFLGSVILYYRYLFVITGLYIFAVSFILGKEKNKVFVVIILTVIALLGLYNNIKMVSDNYSILNYQPIKYMEENIQEQDTIVYTDYGVGSIAAIHFEENKVIFYNEENWGVKEAYKAFEPNYEIKITKDFLEECSNRIWVIDSAYGNAVQEVFDNINYKKVSEKDFYTKYHGYSYKITLVEKVVE